MIEILVAVVGCYLIYELTKPKRKHKKRVHKPVLQITDPTELDVSYHYPDESPTTKMSLAAMSVEGGEISGTDDPGTLLRQQQHIKAMQIDQDQLVGQIAIKHADMLNGSDPSTQRVFETRGTGHGRQNPSHLPGSSHLAHWIENQESFEMRDIASIKPDETYTARADDAKGDHRFHSTRRHPERSVYEI
jgi:hypothetical protein